MNNEIFSKLTKLLNVFLQSNPCINEYFVDPTKLSAMQRIVNEKCCAYKPDVMAMTFQPIRTVQPTTSYTQRIYTTPAYTNANSIRSVSTETDGNLKMESQRLQSQLELTQAQLKSTQAELFMKNQQIQELKSQTTAVQSQTALNQQNQQTVRELKDCKNQLEGNQRRAETEECKATVAELKAERTECKNDIKAKELQFRQELDIFQNLQDNLQLQWNETFTAQTNELRNDMQYKIQENVNKLQQKEAEVVAKNEEIENLKKKIELLAGI